MKSLFLTLTALTLLLTSAHSENIPAPRDSAHLQVFIGTYTGPQSRGIYRLRLDTKTGALSSPSLAAETPSPSFLAIHPNHRFLYAVAETGAESTVSAFAIDRSTGNLSLLNRQPSRGSGPCHLVVDHSGHAVLAANYGAGSVVALPLKPDGSLGAPAGFDQHRGSSINPQRQKEPHAHSINVDPGNHFAVSADLGTDQLNIYRFDAKTASLEPNDPPATPVAPGSGPRHFAFHPRGRFAYVINELSNTITAFQYDGRKGTLREIGTFPTLPAGFSGTSHTAEVQVHPSGKFVYGSNRGHDSIAVFAVNEKTGALQRVQLQPTGGKNPRNFGIDPSGRFLIAANMSSDNLVVFRIDPKTGQLTGTGQTASLSAPVCVKFLPVR